MKGVSRETFDVDKQIQQLAEGCSAFGITLGGERKRKFCDYLEELLEWNRRVNLVSRQDTENIALHHFLDSLSFLPNIEIPQEARMIDVGTGAGFPGIPLKICCPDLRLTLVESTRKKVLFLKHIIDTLRLSGVSVLHERAEALHQDSKYRDNFDIVVARAVSPLRSLTLLCLPFLKPGGKFVAYKGGDVRGELREARLELSKISGRFEREIDVFLPLSNRKRQLIVFTKAHKERNGDAILSKL
ncbi:MAG: 16S rRNA (guanine(527)-N(7))-methyltransferase RsmG [Gemmatimonadota bacterium]|nr:MAG: 16S rRNA (guanine(527)-N(7))-methyltransferase RsmG [Gemmatimonadota bacterium]